MIDTLELGWKGTPISPAELRCFRAAAEDNPIECRVWMQPGAEEGEERSWTATVRGLGRVRLNADGYVSQGRSLLKTRQDLVLGWPQARWSNEGLLSAQQADETFQEVTGRLEQLLPFVDPAQLRVNRADVCYQRKVQSSLAVVQALKAAMKPTRKGAAWFDNQQGVPTGLILRGKAVSHRVYDKGLESGNRDFLNVLRSEEQLRKSAKGMGEIVDIRQRVFNRDGCRNVLNERYLDVAYEEQIDVTDLVEARKDTMALLILHPELIPLYRGRVTKSPFYAMKKKVREWRAAAVPADLRVPEEAWEEEVG